MARKDDYDWLDDPFNDKKASRQNGMSGGMKTALGCGCLLVIVGLVVLAVLVAVNMVDILAA